MLLQLLSRIAPCGLMRSMGWQPPAAEDRGACRRPMLTAPPAVFGRSYMAWFH